MFLKLFLRALTLTHELPEENNIRYFYLRLQFLGNHVGGIFEPRANKSLLPFGSAHSKVSKSSVVVSCFSNALWKSCAHSTRERFQSRLRRLTEAGYSLRLQVSVAEATLTVKCARRARTHEPEERIPGSENKKALIPYFYRI